MSDMRSGGERALVVLAVVWVCGALGTAPRASAQAVYGSIAGTVVDSTGAAVPGATVTITSLERQTSDTVVSNAAGFFSKDRLVPGRYEVRAELTGFKVSVVSDVRVSVDTQAKVDFTLEVGEMTETVMVEGSSLLKADRADVATTFSTEQITELPVLDRNFTKFVLLTPGAARLGWNHATSENPQQSIQTMVNGQHFSGTGYQLDGTENRDPILGIIVINPNLEAIGETKVTAQNYAAEFGQAVAGVVSVQTKSGTNEYHGSAYWFGLYDNFQARNPFTQPEGVAVELLGARYEVVVARAVDAAGGVRQRQQVEDRERLRRQPALRDHVARELAARGRRPVAAQRVEDVDSVLAEVAGARERGRHRLRPRAALGVAQGAVVGEEEPLVLHDRAADRAAELVPARLGQGHPLRLGEGIAGLEVVVQPEPVGAALDLVRPRLGLDRDDTRHRLAELRGVVLRGDLALADRLEVGVDHDDAQDRVAVLGPVELVAGAAEVLAVDHGLDRGLRVLAGSVVPAEPRGARRQQHELGEVPVEDGQLGELLRVEGSRHVGAVRLQQRAALDHHRLRHLADLQREVDLALRVDAHADRGDDRGLETGELGLDLVAAGQQAVLGVEPGVVGHHRVHGLALEAGDRDRGARDGSAGRVDDRPGDAAVDRLCRGGRRARSRTPEQRQQSESEPADRATVAHELSSP